MATLQEALRTPLLTTSFEQALGFENTAFRTYLRMHRGAQKSQSFLLGLSDAMVRSDHPVVRSAAGWAAYEAGVQRTDRKRKSFDRRLDILDRANSLWGESLPLFASAIDAADSEKDYVNLLGLELRTRQARVYLPSMQLAAYWFDGLEVHEDMLKRIRRQTHTGLLNFANYVNELPGDGVRFNKMRGGMCTEVLTGALINDDPYARYLVLPGSIRHDNNITPFSRADLIAIATASPHRRVRVQIASDEELANRDEYGRVIIHDEDLLLPHIKYPRTLLNMYINKNKGLPQTPTDLVWLDMLPGNLASKIDEYASRREERQIAATG